MKNECRQYVDWLKDDLAGELEPAHQRQLAGHLKDCPACRREKAELEATWSRLQEVRDEPAPRHFLVYEDLPGRRANRWNTFGRLPLGWRIAFGSLGAVFCLGLILVISQARIEVGDRSIALSFGSRQPEPSSSTTSPGQEDGVQDLTAMIRSVVAEEHRQWAVELRKEIEALVAQGSQADRDSFELALTSLERRFEDRLGAQEERLQTSFEKVLGDSIDLINGQRRSDIVQIRQVLGQFAAFNRYQAGQSSAIIETLSQIADNRNETRGGTR